MDYEKEKEKAEFAYKARLAIIEKASSLKMQETITAVSENIHVTVDDYKEFLKFIKANKLGKTNGYTKHSNNLLVFYQNFCIIIEGDLSENLSRISNGKCFLETKMKEQTVVTCNLGA